MEKRLLSVIFIICLVCACSREDYKVAQPGSVELIFRTVGVGESKTFFTESTGVIAWNPSEKVNVFFGSKASGSLVSQNTSPSEQVLFKGSLSPAVDINDTTDYFWTVYPYNSSNSCDGESVTLTVPSVQTVAPNTFADNTFPSIARTKTDRLYFQNVCGGARFKVYNSGISKVVFSSIGSEPIAGTVRVSLDEKGAPYVQSVVAGISNITVEAPDEGGFVPGVSYYIAALPTTMSKGFRLLYHKGKQIGVFSAEKSVVMSRSLFGNLIELDKDIEFTEPIDLSASGTANCYIVSKPGIYCLNAGVKGSSTEPLDGTPASAEVLWESFGTDTAPNVGDIVFDVYYDPSKGTVTLVANADGNAVIAVKDDSNNILWSWHIWVCKDFAPVASAQVYNNNAGTMMDRNLGATSATPGAAGSCGLLYQWGRKDPFLGGSCGSDSAASTLSWPSAENASEHLENNNTLNYSLSHPTTYIKNGSSPYDWYCTSESYKKDDLWSSDKSVYDPCPVGWRVPDGGDSGIWSTAFGSSSYYDNGPWGSTNKGMNFGSDNGKSSVMQLGTASTIWYPASGSRHSGFGSLCDVGRFGSYWSCTPYGYSAYRLGFGYDGIVTPSDYNYLGRAYGQSVRCIRMYTGGAGSSEDVEEEDWPEDLSASGTANSYIVSESGRYAFNCKVKGNSTESVGTPASAEVLWESFGTDVTPNVGDIVNKVSLDAGYVKFSTPTEIYNGNAVIAVKDASDNILWSWHIWVCKDFDPKASAQVYNNNAGTMMDRNLGATSATPGDVHALGLLYQWGRKDPFIGYAYINIASRAQSTLTSWPTVSASDHLKNNNTLDYATANPTTFINIGSYSHRDWYCTDSTYRDDKLWTSTKTKFDPCPPGWQVPDIDVWVKSLGTDSSWETKSNYDTSLRGMDFGKTDRTMGTGTIWYPTTGWLAHDSGRLQDPVSKCMMWSSSTYENTAIQLTTVDSGNVNPSYRDHRATGGTVRCLSESK